MDSTNRVVANAMAARSARNERLVPFDRDAVKPGDSVWFKGREFEYKGSHGSLLVELEDVFDGEAEFVSPYDRNLKMAANAIGDLDFDMKGVYETAKKMLAAGATHKGGYHWSVPKTYATGAGVVASRVGGAVKVVRDDPDRQGFVIAEITDPLAQALERKGVPNARTARNYSRDTESFAVRKQFETQLERIIQKFISDVSSVGSKAKSEYRRLQKSDPQNAFWVEEVQGWVDSLKEAVDEVW